MPNKKISPWLVSEPTKYYLTVFAQKHIVYKIDDENLKFFPWLVLEPTKYNLTVFAQKHTVYKIDCNNLKQIAEV